MGVPMIACHCDVCKSTSPKDKRTRSAIKIEFNNRVVVVDCGPDFRQQMLDSETTKLDAILFTHAHKDHTGGLDDVRAFNWINKQPTMLYGEEEVLKSLKVEYSYAFKSEDEKYPGVPELVLNQIDENPFSVFSREVIPIRVYHHMMPVLGFRIGNFSYITDASRIPPESMKKLAGSEVLVVNALRLKEHVSHFNLREALEVIETIAPRQAFLTHISHHLGFHDEVAKLLPHNVFPGFDGLTVEMEE